MKKTAIAAEDTTPAISDDWASALRLLDDDLLRRGAAERTRRAYRTDLRQFAVWASAAGIEPADAGPRELRRYAADALRAPRRAEHRRAQARRAARLLPRAARARRRRRRTRPSSSPSPKRAAAPAARAARRRARRAARPDPGRRRRSSCATARCSSSPTRCGLRAEELVNLDIDVGRLRRRGAARRGQGRQDPHRPGRRARAAGARRATWSAAAAGARQRPTASRRCSSRKSGRRLSTSDVRRRLARLGARAPRCRAASRRTRCATRSRRTCSTAAPTCARSRSCSGTAASRRRRSTLG